MGDAGQIRDDPVTTRPPLARAARIAGVTVLVLLAVVDIAMWTADSTVTPVLVLALLGLEFTAVVWPVRRRPRWLTPEIRAGVPALASLAVTAASPVTELASGGPGEAVLLLCLLLSAVRHARPSGMIAVATVTGVAVVVLPLRYSWDEVDLGALIGISFVLGVLVALVAGLGGYLRAMDQRRRLALARARRTERLAMAADLHDFVAHHVTGILVQAQMGQALLEIQPERLGQILAGIERAAGETLASMRRTVDVLRTEPGAGPARDGHRPAGDLAGLPGLIDGFRSAGPPVTLRRDPAVPEDLPHETQAAAFRVVQEALTNVRRHGADASDVAVDLHYERQRLTVTVRDNGTAPAAPEVARGAGFGLTGLDERVTALGGRLRAGPRPGGGWELTAVLPDTTRDP